MKAKVDIKFAYIFAYLLSYRSYCSCTHLSTSVVHVTAYITYFYKINIRMT